MLAFKNPSYKLILSAILLLCLLPTAIVFAQAWASHPTVGMSGVTNSQLTVGMQAIINSNPFIGIGVSGNLNPSSQTFKIVAMYPLIFLISGLIVLIDILFGGGLNVKQLLWMMIAVQVIFALLVIIQSGATGLLGG